MKEMHNEPMRWFMYVLILDVEKHTINHLIYVLMNEHIPVLNHIPVHGHRAVGNLHDRMNWPAIIGKYLNNEEKTSNMQEHFSVFIF